MLTAKKNSNLKRIISDFRVLYSSLQGVDMTFSLIRDAFAILECSKCEFVSVIDLKDACHTVRLSEIPNLTVLF